MRALFPFVLAPLIALGACVTGQTQVATLTPQEVYVAANAFDAVEATATAYLNLPLCPAAKVCRTAIATGAIIGPIRDGRKARNALEAYIAANPGVAAVPVSLSTALNAAVSSAQAIIAQYGI